MIVFTKSRELARQLCNRRKSLGYPAFMVDMGKDNKTRRFGVKLRK